MKHLGDITKISGYTVPTVDCVIGGSPCQDLSVAGKRAGLDGERSGLFMEQIRIIKEMRENDRRNGRADELIRPRYMLWENVPGALSSNKGEDFRIVLEETAKIADENAVIPRPANGKWTTSGCILADGWSIAWRILDAQFWGVPQRRRRIALVADFGGQSAPEILFERKGVSRNIESSGAPRERITADTQGSSGVHDRARAPRGGVISLDRAAYNQGQNAQFDIGISDDGVAQTVVAKGPGAVAYVLENHPQDSRIGFASDNVCPTLHKQMGTGGNNTPMVMQPLCYGISSYDSNAMKSPNPHSGFYEADTSRCLDSNGGNPACNQGGVAVVCVDMGAGKSSCGVSEDVAPTLACTHGGEPAIAQSGWCNGVVQPQAVDCRNGTEGDINGTLQAKESGGTSVNLNNVVRQGYIVRRLTPLECERLQGFPDNWTDIGDYIDTTGKKRKASDAARYKALGNSIALPQWKWIIKRMCANYPTDATMASLFDGIGGFPYLWEQINGKGSCLWASEIEEFPIAVTKARIGE